MSWLNELARRWADPKLVKEANDLRYELVMAQAANERMRQQRDRSDKDNNGLLEQMARMAAEKKFQDDHIRTLETTLSGARQELRQAQREIARVGQEAAEMAVTADGLGLVMAELERRVPTQRDGGDDV